MGNEEGSYNRPKNKNQDTHLDDGSINPDFKDTTYVHLQCDNNCNCESEEFRPTCEINAFLKFPETDAVGPYYGYHNDYVVATKDGKKSECYFDNQVTSWGCIHEG